MEIMKRMRIAKLKRNKRKSRKKLNQKISIQPNQIPSLRYFAFHYTGKWIVCLTIGDKQTALYWTECHIVRWMENIIE